MLRPRVSVADAREGPCRQQRAVVLHHRQRLDRCEPDDDDRRSRGENQSLAELRSAGRALIDVSRRLHSAIIVRALLLTASRARSEEHTSELQSRGHLVCRLLLEKKKSKIQCRL